MKAPYYITQMAYSERSGPGKKAKSVAENDLMYQFIQNKLLCAENEAAVVSVNDLRC